MDIKVMLADDDAGMRLVLKKAIIKSGDFKIIGEAEDGNAALRLYEEQRPDVVFLDVEMPGATGVECAKKIADIDPKTVIIFATAHEEYMPEAFGVYAFDYLVKPFRLERLHKTLERIKAAGAARACASGGEGPAGNSCAPGHKADASGDNGDAFGKLPDVRESRPELLQNRPPNFSKAPGKLMIRNRDGISLVDLEDILLIQRENRSTVIYTSHDRFTTSEGLSELEEKLDGSLFFRCHKSYIVNLGAISKIYPYGRWTYIVKLKGTEKDALLTHEKYEELEKLFA